jgi:TRAP-type C4-dicarboxylate transport system permease small subunit
MRKFLRALRAVNDVIYTAIGILAGVIVAVMLLVVSGGAATRNISGIGYSMVQELPPMLMPWLIFPMAGVLLRFDAHITVDFLPAILSPPRARILRLIVSAIAIVAGAIFFIAGWQSVQLFHLTGQVTEMEWSFPIWWVYLSFPVGFAILISFAFENLLAAALGDEVHLNDAPVGASIAKDI